ncbi:hypothetical protein [Winogradskyella sp. R77965]|uniref:hypothetical protein n=1 Tax=Winogradskyella sp. R77965 TaxID=3093872 RepID=UPI0037DD1D70
MKTLLNTFCIFLLVLTAHSQSTLKISDLEILNNTSWEGKLTYKDYQSGEPRTIETTLQIKIEGDKIISNVQYTYEPNKNNKSSVKLKKNGTYYGNEKILSNTFENGIRTLVTTYKGRDAGKKATMYMTHQFSETTYKVTKEVQFKNSEERFIRNTYEFTKL